VSTTPTNPARNARRALRAGVAALLLALAAPALAQISAPPITGGGELAADKVPTQIEGLDVDEQVGNTLPMDVAFTNAQGKVVRLGEYFQDGKPAIIAMVYYKCPIVCTVVLNRFAETINALDYTVGTDYRALVFSVDPGEDTKLAASTKLSYISGYNRDADASVQAGWEFHTTDDSAARRLGEALGFKYRRLDTGAYSHPVALMIVTPDGKVSRYLYGFTYPARDVKLALLEASQGKLVKSIGDRMLNFCYMFDPKAGSYTLQAYRVMQIAGVITVTALATLIGGLFIGERLRRNRAARLAPQTNDPRPNDPQGT
jgi:protein SCO1/2